MTNAFFGFKRTPFTKQIDTADVFLSEGMRELLARLDHMKQHRGLMLLTGESGLGKTLALRTFVEKLNTNLYLPVYIPLSTVSALEFYRQLNFHLTGESLNRKVDLFRSIHAAVKDLVTNRKKVPVIICDEAHLLKPDNLQEIPIILNFDLDSTDPLLFIITGKSHLRDRIARPVHSSINQRFTLKYHMVHMSKSETAAYVQHRLKICGCNNDIFSPQALEAIAQNTAGVPRVIDNIARKAIALAVHMKKQTISEEEIYTASKEL